MTKTWIVIFMIVPLLGLAQQHKKKISNGAGTMFGYCGYMVKSSYTESNLRLVGSGYDFTLISSKANDKESYSSFPDQVEPALKMPQMSVLLGYNFKNFWAVTVAYDRMRYVFLDRNQVNITGAIDPAIVDNGAWSGAYANVPTVTDRSTFHYENDALNYFRVGLLRTDQVWRAGFNNEFVVTSMAGISAGALISKNDFNFDNKFTRDNTSLSGFGISGHAGLRFEFFRHFFLHASVGGGVHQQLKVSTRQNDAQYYAKQAYGFMTFDTGAGIILYVRPKNACSGCPIW